jgi:hypothetical protein
LLDQSYFSHFGKISLKKADLHGIKFLKFILQGHYGMKFIALISCCCHAFFRKDDNMLVFMPRFFQRFFRNDDNMLVFMPRFFQQEPRTGILNFSTCRTLTLSTSLQVSLLILTPLEV